MQRSDRLHDLEVLVIGIEELISRDVVRSLVADGAVVTAAAADEHSLAHLQRDLALYRTTAKFAQIDLLSVSEMRLFADNLRGQGKLPHIIACCQTGFPFPLPQALALLQPSLVLHAAPAAGTRLARAVASLNTPTLADLLGRSRLPGLFDPETGPQRVVIARQSFTLRRWDAASGFGAVPRFEEHATHAAPQARVMR